MSDAVPRISVLLPAYQADAYVDAAIESVRAQTFSDWEIVAIDDASTDGTYDRLKAWAGRDSRIRVWRNDRNRGVTGNWNECLRRARGEFVVKVDADDVWRPRVLEELTAEMGDPAVVGSGVRALQCDEDLQPVGAYRGDFGLIEASLDPYRDAVLPCADWLRIVAAGHQPWNGDAFLVRRSVAEHIGGLDERFGCASDTAFLTSILEQPGEFAHRAYAGVLYRKIRGSISEESRRQGWLRWEGTVLQLRTLSRLAARGRMPRSLRMQYVQFWERWQTLAANGAAPEIPATMRANLEAVVSEVPPPPAGDRAARWLRNRLGRLPL